MSRLAAVFAQSMEATCWVENEDVVEAAPSGDAPATSEINNLNAYGGVPYIGGFTVMNFGKYEIP